MITLLSAAVCLALVGWASYLKTKGTTGTADGYFLAGRSLTGTFVAGSLLLTNLSAEQLIGLSGSAYATNLSSMAWEVTAGIATVVMALVFLPRYLRAGFTTLPQFLAERYDDRVRRASAILFVIGYTLITIPSVLYAGSVAVVTLVDLPVQLGVSWGAALAGTMLCIALIGAVYAIWGGLRAIAVSDTLFGFGLLALGIAVPLLGLRMLSLRSLGEADILAGWQLLQDSHAAKLNAIGSAMDPTPFGTLFTGMILANLFYWGTNQYVIQRTLGARSLAAAQQGVLAAGFFKLSVVSSTRQRNAHIQSICGRLIVQSFARPLV